MTSSVKCNSSKSRPGANPVEETLWLDGLLAQTNTSDVLCEALTRALEGADKAEIDKAVGAVAGRMALIEEEKEEWAFWKNLLELMSDNDHVHPAAKTASHRGLCGRYSPNAINFYAECIVEHVSKKGDCSYSTAEGAPTETAVFTRTS